MENVILNNQEISQEEFLQKKEDLDSKKGVKIVEVAKNEYKIKIQG